MSSPSPPTLTPKALFDLTGRVAVVTGGSTGIGLMQSRALHDAGARVYIVGRRSDVLENAVKSWGFAGKLEADVTNVEDIERIVQEMEKAEGKVDIVVANAGASGPTHYGADTSFPDQSQTPGKGLKKMSPTDYKNEILKQNSFQNWNDLFNINTTHILFAAVSFLPLMAKASEEAKKEKRPHTATFITTGSISGIVKQAQMHYGESLRQLCFSPRNLR
jgi:NAD(P)-dependent dehydrogenase (short-subunit alcohol dehydrogenase family)